MMVFSGYACRESVSTMFGSLDKIKTIYCLPILYHFSPRYHGRVRLYYICFKINGKLILSNFPSM
jgi:hypothetical protein